MHSDGSEDNQSDGDRRQRAVGLAFDGVWRQPYDVVLEGLTQADLDVCDREAVRKQVALLRPDVVIHCAAYTAVDAAESNEGEAHRVNAEAVAHVAEACVAEGASMIHISTDYVFGLTEHRPLLPTDEVNPSEPTGAPNERVSGHFSNLG